MQEDIADRQAIPDRPPAHLPAPVKRVHNRHYLQQYFTKRAWNIAQTLIDHFTRPGEVVLDPFCGAGVVPVEALVLRRIAWACDINPWAVFITEMTAIAPVDIPRLEAAYAEVRQKAAVKIDELHACPASLESLLGSSEYPRDALPSGVFQQGLQSLDDLFSPLQLGELVVLRAAIATELEEPLQNLLRLAFSITLDRANKMYTARGRSPRRGQSAPFQLRRYQVWDDFTYVPTIELFDSAFKKMRKAKQDANRALDRYVSRKSLRVWRGSATRLTNTIPEGSVDYILTDPPYGRNYNYLDLSMIWNAWLGLSVSPGDYTDEIIQGGSQHKTPDEYRALLSLALEQMARVLKPDRWLTLIYSESNMETWSSLIGTCRDHGLRYIDCSWTDSALPTHKKHQSPYASAAGEYYINFRKIDEATYQRVYAPPRRLPVASDEQLVRLAIEKVIVTYLGASIEVIASAVISRQLLGEDFLRQRNIRKLDIREELKTHFDPDDGRWQLPDLEHVDTRIDEYELLRYAVFHTLLRSPDGGATPEQIRQRLAPVLTRSEGRLPLNHLRAIMQSFASTGPEDTWQIDSRRLDSFTQLRLFFERSTVDTIRAFMEETDDARRRAHKNTRGIAELARVLSKNQPGLAAEATRLALLSEHVAAAVVNEFPDKVSSISVVDDLASGKVQLDQLRDSPLHVLIASRKGTAMSEDDRFHLSERIFGPVLEAHNVWFTPVLVTEREDADYPGPHLRLMAS